MDREQEMIHQQMEATRAGLTDKLSALESQVSGTVQAATNAVESTKDAVTGTVEAVTDTVESVKDTVQDTVEAVTDKVSETITNVTEQFQETVKSVSETLNVKLQAERHPWGVFGGAVVLGALGGFLLSGRSRREPRRSRDDFPAGYRSRGEAPTREEPAPAAPPAPAGPSVVGTVASAAGSALGSAASAAGSALGGLLGEQLGKLKGLAIGAMMGVVRDIAARSLPENLKGRVSEEVDRITRSLGGEPIQGPILPEPKAEEPRQGQAPGHTPGGRGQDYTPVNYGGVGVAATAGESTRY
jgi:ElaB/YqjD/DUF883 family membrane-anchored ribosome-binding protein